jgi:hypothetical protein
MTSAMRAGLICAALYNKEYAIIRIDPHPRTESSGEKNVYTVDYTVIVKAYEHDLGQLHVDITSVMESYERARVSSDDGDGILVCIE